MVQRWDSSLRDALVARSASKSHLGKLREGNYITGSSAQVHTVLEAGVAPQSSSCTSAGQPLCRPGWLLLLLPFPLEPSLGGHGWAGSLLLSAVLVAPYPEMLPLACLQETLHQHPEQANPAHSPGTSHDAWSLPGPATRSRGWQRDSCQGWQVEGKAKLVQLGLAQRGAELLRPDPGGERAP